MTHFSQKRLPCPTSLDLNSEDLTDLYESLSKYASSIIIIYTNHPKIHRPPPLVEPRLYCRPYTFNIHFGRHHRHVLNNREHRNTRTLTDTQIRGSIITASSSRSPTRPPPTTTTGHARERGRMRRTQNVYVTRNITMHVHVYRYFFV